MQSMDILIVICGGNTAAHRGGGLQCMRAQRAMPVRNGNRIGAQKSAAGDKEKAAPRTQHTLHRFHGTEKTRPRLLVVLGLQDFATTVKAVRADVVTQVGFAGRRLDCQVRCNQEIVRTVHTALRRGLLILLNCHDDS
jgi:hypothetical protein